jgi:hypothetical protein
MSAALVQSLRAEGLDVTVEARDRLAIVVPSRDAAPIRLTTVVRERIVRLARAHGFSLVAIEIPDRAELHRSQP